jgi:hypothetical protein
MCTNMNNLQADYSVYLSYASDEAAQPLLSEISYLLLLSAVSLSQSNILIHKTELIMKQHYTIIQK